MPCRLGYTGRQGFTFSTIKTTMKKPTRTASLNGQRNHKASVTPATLDPQTAAAGFLHTNRLAFHDDPKRFYLYAVEQQAWHSIKINQLQRRLKTWVLDTHHNSASATALKKMVAELEVAAPVWSPSLKPGQMVVANGVLDVANAIPTLSPKDHHTHFADALTINYNPEAQCPQFRKFLAESLSVDDAELVQKWAGSLLVGPNQSQAILVVVGESGTGKGTLVNLLTRLVGLELTAELRAEQLNERFEMSAFIGKRLLVASEINPDLLNLKGIGRLKALVGQDSMEAELKHGNQRTQFKGDFHVILHGNQLDQQQWSADLDAFRRRLLVIEYAKPRPATIIPNLADRLWLKEGSGILQWAVEGVGCYRTDLLKSGHFVLTADQQHRVNRIIPPAPNTPNSEPAPTSKQPSPNNHFLRHWFNAFQSWLKRFA